MLYSLFVFCIISGWYFQSGYNPIALAFVVHCRMFYRRLLHRKFRSVLTIANVHLCDVSGQPLATDVGEEGAVQARKSPIDQTLVSLAGAAGLSPNSTAVLSN